MSLRLKNRKVSKIFLLTSGEYRITFSDKNIAIITETRLITHLPSWEFETIFLKEKKFVKLDQNNIVSIKGINQKAKDRLERISVLPVVTTPLTYTNLAETIDFSHKHAEFAQPQGGFLDKMSSIIKKIRL